MQRIFLILLLIFLLAGLAYGGFFAYKIYSVSKRITVNNETAPSFLQTIKSISTDNFKDLKRSSPDRINILLLGIAGKGKPGQYLTDTIILASVNTKTKQTAMFSIPRDLYVSLPETGIQGKINTLYQIGLNNKTRDGADPLGFLLEAVKNVTSLDIDYYAVLNFDGFRKAIDDIGGINIINERDIYDASYPGPNYSYEIFELKKGFYHLDGATALKYARERHNDPQGDFGRAKRQQEVMQSAKNKIFSVGTLINPKALNDLLNTLGDNIITNVAPQNLGIFYELEKKLDTQNITNVVIDAWSKDSLLKIAHFGQASVLIPRVGNWSEVQDLAQNIFDLDKLKRRREEIAKEDATLLIINKSGDPKILARLKKLLSENLNYKNVIVAYNNEKILTEKTIVYDLTNGGKPFTSDELVTKLPATISYTANNSLLTAISTQKPDIIVVVGKDLIEKYNMEEGTIQELNNERDNQESQDFINN